MKKVLFAVIVVLVCIASCSKKGAPTKEKAIDGGQVFSTNCQRCHHSEDPAPGKAPNLAKSKLDKAGLVAVITNGRDHMPAFADKLSAKEIAAVSDYILSIKK